MALLYIVATPIGNLEDITLRSIRVLKEADVIACEDTRHTQILLNHLNITSKRLISCYSQNEKNSADGIINLLKEGLNVAYCSDAGTPGISDPGSMLVQKVLDAGFSVVPVPGVSACTTLLSVSGLAGKGFTFEGFLSPKAGKMKKRLAELLSREEAFIIYESPFRIRKTLAAINELAPDRVLVLGREMTKVHEQFLRGTAQEVLEHLEIEKGEFALCILPPLKKCADNSDCTENYSAGCGPAGFDGTGFLK